MTTQREAKLWRQKYVRLFIYATPDEAKVIRENASRTGLSVAAYLRKLGLSENVSGVPAAVLDICCLNKEVERIREVLEQLLSDAPTQSAFGRQVNGLLVDLRKTQAALLSLAERL